MDNVLVLDFGHMCIKYLLLDSSAGEGKNVEEGAIPSVIVHEYGPLTGGCQGSLFVPSIFVLG
jgi:hypothetical protein